MCSPSCEYLFKIIFTLFKISRFTRYKETHLLGCFKGAGAKLNRVTVSVGGYGLIRSVSLWTAGERHGNEVTPMEIQQPAGLPCLSVSASNGREKKGRSSRFVLFSRSPPSSLCLGFIWPTGGCMQTGAGCL